MLTKFASFLIFLILSITHFSCAQNNVQSSNVWFDSTAFPKQTFYSVKLFTLDTSKTKQPSDNEEGYRKRKELEYAGNAGYTFIDQTGKSKTKYYTYYELDSVQIKKLQIFLKEKTCTGEDLMVNTCAPTYRNVFVFYDQNKIPIAQVHVCFECKKTVFRPDKEYMCAFDNKVNFKDFENFAASIKKNNVELDKDTIQ